VFHDLKDSYWHEKASQKYQARKLLIGQKKNEEYSSFFLQASSWLAQNSGIFHCAVHSSIALSDPQCTSNWSLKNCRFICNAIFFTWT